MSQILWLVVVHFSLLSDGRVDHFTARAAPVQPSACQQILAGLGPTLKRKHEHAACAIGSEPTDASELGAQLISQQLGMRQFIPSCTEMSRAVHAGDHAIITQLYCSAG